MDAFNTLTVIRMVSYLCEKLEEAGLTLRLLGPGPELEMIYKGARPDRAAPQKIFRDDARAVSAELLDAFWLVGLDRYGPAIFQACRGIDLGDRSLADHLTTDGGLYVPGNQWENNPIPEVRAAAAWRLHGVGCYFGETWFRPESDDVPGFRGKGISDLILRLAMGTAFCRHEARFMFGFCEQALAVRGIPIQYGHYQCYPHGATWTRPDGPQDDVWLTFTAASDFGDLFGGFARDRYIPQHT